MTKFEMSARHVSGLDDGEVADRMGTAFFAACAQIYAAKMGKGGTTAQLMSSAVDEAEMLYNLAIARIHEAAKK